MLPCLTDWCGREDSNFHGLSPTTTSTLRVYQFRHDRRPEEKTAPIGRVRGERLAKPGQGCKGGNLCFLRAGRARAAGP